MNDENSQNEGLPSSHEHELDTTQHEGRIREPHTQPEPTHPPFAPQPTGATRFDLSGMEQRGVGPSLGDGYIGPTQLTVASQQYHSGPIPSPAQLAGYKEVQADLPERIVKMAELSINGREYRANKQVDAEIESAKTGQALAFLLVTVFFIASVVFFAMGKNVAGACFMGIPAVLLVQSFLGNAHKPDSEKKPDSE